MAGFRCGTCGKLHDHLPMDIGYRRPEPYFAVPEEERARRIYETDDLCVIDGKTFMIRGVLYLPISGGDQQFGWGVWAVVSEQDFQRYLDAWDHDTEDDVPPFTGRLASAIPGYPGSDQVDLDIRLQSGGQRPRFTVRSETHPLGVDQRTGITLAKAHSFVEQRL
jgi:hypothetical protein